MSEYVNAQKAANENGLYLKVVTGVKSFDSYNSFFNIYDESEEPCRRIVVVTKNKELEEVYDDSPAEEIKEVKIVDDNIWIKDFSLLTVQEKIDLGQFEISKRLVEEFIKSK